METLNILVGSYNLRSGGGADLAAWGQAHELAKHHNVELICDSNTDAGFGNPLVSDLPIHKYMIKPWTLRTIAREINKKRYDLISSHTVPIDLLACMSHTPHLLHDYGLPDLKTTLQYESLKYYAQVNMARMMTSRSPWTMMILPSSHYIEKQLKTITRHNTPTRILHTGIKFPEHTPMDDPMDGEPYILFVGRHVRYKRVDELLEIFGRIRKERPDLHLVTIGLRYDHLYDTILDKIAERIGNVHMLGYVPDAWRYMQHATIYATCSQYEGEDRPVIEAQSQGIPTIAYDNCSHPEIIKHGKCTRNQEEFVKTLLKYADQPYRNHGIAAWTRREYSLENTIREYNEILKKVL